MRLILACVALALVPLAASAQSAGSAPSLFAESTDPNVGRAADGGFYYFCMGVANGAAFYSRIIHDSGKRPSTHLFFVTDDQYDFETNFEHVLEGTYGTPAGLQPECSNMLRSYDAAIAKRKEDVRLGFWSAVTFDVYPPEAAAPSPVGVAKAAVPKGNWENWFMQDGYPPAALRNGEQGTVRFVLLVEPSGRVSNCQIVQSSGSSLLDQTTCSRMIRQMRFAPGQDQSGNAVPSAWTNSYTWKLPPGAH